MCKKLSFAQFKKVCKAATIQTDGAKKKKRCAHNTVPHVVKLFFNSEILGEIFVFEVIDG